MDDDRPRPAPGDTFGASLETLSLAELEARIAALEAEIARTRTEISRKQGHAQAAASIFKS